jgi:hypothetical protein
MFVMSLEVDRNAHGVNKQDNVSNAPQAKKVGDVSKKDQKATSFVSLSQAALSPRRSSLSVIKAC